MHTNVKATNWPTREKAKDTLPREPTKGHNVASKRTYEIRRKRAVASKMDKLLENATRYYARADHMRAQGIDPGRVDSSGRPLTK